MGKRKGIFFSALLAAVMAGLAFVCFRKPAPGPPEPVYNGRPISYWIDRPSINYPVANVLVMPQVQFPRSVDADALPYLTNALQRRNGPFLNLSLAIWRLSPVFIKNRWVRPLDVAPVRAAAALVIGKLGSTGQPAIPALVRTLREDKDPDVRLCAVFALGQIGRDNKDAAEVLAAAANETNSPVAKAAQEAFRRVARPPAAQSTWR